MGFFQSSLFFQYQFEPLYLTTMHFYIWQYFGFYIKLNRKLNLALSSELLGELNMITFCYGFHQIWCFSFFYYAVSHAVIHICLLLIDQLLHICYVGLQFCANYCIIPISKLLEQAVIIVSIYLHKNSWVKLKELSSNLIAIFTSNSLCDIWLVLL